MIQSITNFLIIFFIFQQLKSQIDKNGVYPFCDENIKMPCLNDSFRGRGQVNKHSMIIWQVSEDLAVVKLHLATYALSYSTHEAMEHSY